MQKMKTLMAVSFVAVALSLPVIHLAVTAVTMPQPANAITVYDTDNEWDDVVNITGDKFISRQQTQRVLLDMVWSLVISLAIGLPAGLLIARSLSRPIQQLNDSIKSLGKTGSFKQIEVTKGPVEIRELAESFNRVTSELEKKDRLTRNLVADVSHELMTPLTVLEGNLRAIIDDVYELDKEEISLLYERTTHMIRLVKDLRELTNAETGNISLKGEVIEITRMIRKLSEMYAPLAGDKNLSISYNIPNFDIHCLIDRKRFFQVMDNLIGNAVHYTPEGGSITLGVELLGDTAIISVADTGVGITRDKLKAVFRRLYRINPEERSDLGNAGLGLAISRAIIEKMNGSISVKSDGPGKGSVFSIMLPAVYESIE